MAYTEADWEDVKYSDQWHGKDKEQLGFDFPNIPYIIEGDFKLTESSAIQRYIIERSEKKELLGKDIKERGQVNQLLGVMSDVRTPIVGLYFDKEWETKKAEVFEKIKPKLDQF